MANEITLTAEIAQPGHSFGGNITLEEYKEARQRKREQMAKDKQSRVTEVLSALSLTGTGRRITSSLMGPGGAERTGMHQGNYSSLLPSISLPLFPYFSLPLLCVV